MTALLLLRQGAAASRGPECTRDGEGARRDIFARFADATPRSISMGVGFGAFCKTSPRRRVGVSAHGYFLFATINSIDARRTPS